MVRDHFLACHAPQINPTCEPYVRWWAGIWGNVTGMVDPKFVLVVADTNSGAWPAHKGTPRPENAGYRTFLQPFNLQNLVYLHPLHSETYSCFRGLRAPAPTWLLATTTR